MIDQLIACALSPAIAAFLFSCPNLGEPRLVKLAAPIILEARRIPIPAAGPNAPTSPIVEIPMLPPDDIPLPIVGSGEALEILIAMIEADNEAPPSDEEMRLTEVALSPFGGRGPMVRDGVFARLAEERPILEATVEVVWAVEEPIKVPRPPIIDVRIPSDPHRAASRLGLKTGY